ncbi:MAG: MFS transporter [Bacteroidia bacterium]|nr:MFS transporter [Bacteroidia bacterium]
MALFNLRGLNPSESRTFRLHLAYNIIEGFIAGILALNEFVFIKSLHGSNYMLSFLYQFSVIVLLPTIITNELLNRVKNRKRLLMITAYLTRLPLIILLFFPRNPETLAHSGLYHYLFLIIFLSYYFANPFVLPNINLFLKNNYEPGNFGRLYSYSVSANMTMILAVTLLFGVLLDADNFAFTYVYPAIAVLGVTSVFLLTRIHINEDDSWMDHHSFFRKVSNSLVNMKKIFRGNKAFLSFEIGFMIYGIAYMSTISVVTIFLNKKLEMNYSSIALYKNMVFIFAIISTPYYGKLLGKIDPRKFMIWSYLFYLLHISFVEITQFIPYYFSLFRFKIFFMLIPSVVFYGLFTSTMTLAFYIGTVYFCQRKYAGDYQAVHLSLTGIRAMFAPALGIFFYETIGYTGTFLISIMTLILAIILMITSMRKTKIFITDGSAY